MEKGESITSVKLIQSKMPGKIMIVVTNHGELGNTGKKTGWYLPEVAHPYDVFKKAGFNIDFVSPKGGKAPMDEGSYEAFKNDPSSQKFYADHVKDKCLGNTKSPSEVTASEYDAIVYAGGHGPMFDLPENDDVAKLCTKVYEKGGVVGAVCHGTVGLLPVHLSNGEYLIKGKTITSFTDDEEDAVQLTSAMPFLLETRLREKERGANFVCGKNFEKNVQVCERIVTGQNPASAMLMAEEVVKAISNSGN